MRHHSSEVKQFIPYLPDDDFDPPEDKIYEKNCNLCKNHFITGNEFSLFCDYCREQNDEFKNDTTPFRLTLFGLERDHGLF